MLFSSLHEFIRMFPSDRCLALDVFWVFPPQKMKGSREDVYWVTVCMARSIFVPVHVLIARHEEAEFSRWLSQESGRRTLLWPRLPAFLMPPKRNRP